MIRLASVLTLIFSFAFLQEVSANPPIRIGLKEALDKNMVGVTAVGTGQSYNQRALRLKVTNKGGAAMMVTMDPGLVFKPEDTIKQDLVLAGAETLLLSPFKDGTVDVQTFCAKSYGSGPGSNDAYGNPKMGSEKLVTVVQYIKNNRLFDHLGQSAVWVVTNNHPLGSAFDPAREMISKKLIEFMAGVLGLQEPDYYTVYAVNTAAGHPVFERKVLHIYAMFEVQLEEPKKLTLGIYDAAGKQIQGVFENRMFAGKKGHRFKVDFEAKNAAAGNYYVRLREGETILQEKELKLE